MRIGKNSTNRGKEECTAKEEMEAKEQHPSQVLSKIHRINIIAGGLQRRMEPVRYYVDLTSQIEIMFPQIKVALGKRDQQTMSLGHNRSMFLLWKIRSPAIGKSRFFIRTL